MYCTKCGTNVTDGAIFCGACGQPVAGLQGQPFVGAPGQPVIGAAPPVSGPSVAPLAASGWPAPPPVFVQGYVPLPSPYAGFWLRFVAHIIDSLLILMGFGVIVLVTIAIVGVGFFKDNFRDSETPDDFLTAGLVGVFLMVILVCIVGVWLYFAAMESSIHQGTLGKLSLGLIVTDLQGRRVTFGRASGRFFSKIVTGLIPFALGYIMAGFTEKKQALHDMIASCLVLRKN
jgi:uncharacterized RDD family membrane protein YckC